MLKISIDLILIQAYLEVKNMDAFIIFINNILMTQTIDYIVSKVNSLILLYLRCKITIFQGNFVVR